MTKNYDFLTLPIVVLVVSCLFALSYMLNDVHSEKLKQHLQKSTLTYASPTERVMNVIESLPEDSVLRSNLYVVLGAEYSGFSGELNETLQTYAEMKLEELRREKK